MGVLTSRLQADPTQVSCSAEIPVC
jgi:hypothetical protein